MSLVTRAVRPPVKEQVSFFFLGCEFLTHGKLWWCWPATELRGQLKVIVGRGIIMPPSEQFLFPSNGITPDFKLHSKGPSIGSLWVYST